jgi:hypothetical protein
MRDYLLAGVGLALDNTIRAGDLYNWKTETCLTSISLLIGTGTIPTTTETEHSL